jgi:hypothetical protein
MKEILISIALFVLLMVHGREVSWSGAVLALTNNILNHFP